MPLVATIPAAIATSSAIGAAGAIGSALIGKSAADKAREQLNNLQYQPIDLEKLKTDAQANAETNLAKSIALEQKYMPQVSAARFGLQTQIAQDLSRGGNLPLDVANQVTKAGMSQAGAGGFGAGPLTAAQLGLSSLQLRNQAQERANAYLASNPLPVSGLDPGALASAAIGQNQAQNQFNLGKAGGQANLIQSQGNAMSAGLGGLAGVASSTANMLGGYYGNKSYMPSGFLGGNVGFGAANPTGNVLTSNITSPTTGVQVNPGVGAIFGG